MFAKMKFNARCLWICIIEPLLCCHASTIHNKFIQYRMQGYSLFSILSIPNFQIEETSVIRTPILCPSVVGTSYHMASRA